MRRIAFLGATTAVLFSGAVVLAAASPSASPSPSSSPRASATSTPSASSATPKAAPKAATTATTFSATVQPLQIAGSATVTEQPDGSGTVTLRISGLLDAQRWTVDVDGGTIAMPNEHREIAFKAGVDVTRLAMDTVSVRLSKAEMTAFLSAQKSGGVVAIVSDGTREGYAQFSAA
jgi:hypothetical protein